MKTIIAAVLATAFLVSLADGAQAYGRHRVCYFHHHHRICHYR